MMETGQKELTSAAEFVCPRHPETRLRFVLAGGAGHCSSCNAYQQSANHPMPARPVRLEAGKPARRKSTKRKKTARKVAKTAGSRPKPRRSKKAGTIKKRGGATRSAKTTKPKETNR